jgi:hypothetical protein
MGFNSTFKGLKLLKTPGTDILNNLNDPVLNVLTVQRTSMKKEYHHRTLFYIYLHFFYKSKGKGKGKGKDKVLPRTGHGGPEGE